MKNGKSADQVKNGGHSPFNMLDAVENLKKSGMPDEHAEAVVRLQYGLIESHLATKRDIAETKRDIAETKRDIAELREATKRDIAELREETKRDIAETRRDIAELREATKGDIKGIDLKIAIIEKEIGENRKAIGENRKAIGENRKEIVELRKETKDQTLKIIGVLGGLIALLKFLPDFFN